MPIEITQQVEGDGYEVPYSTTGRPDLQPSLFERLVTERGLYLKQENTMRCACIQSVSGSALPSCVNCKGLGFVFYNSKQIRGVIQRISKSRKPTQSGETEIKESTLTVNYTDRISWMDRITLMDGESLYFENLYPRTRKVGGVDKIACLLQYEALNVEFCQLFLGVNEPHKMIFRTTDYVIDNRIFYLQDSLISELNGLGITNYQIAIKYSHHPVYYVVEIDHDIRNTKVADGGLEVTKNLPLSCTIRKAHYVEDINTFN